MLLKIKNLFQHFLAFFPVENIKHEHTRRTVDSFTANGALTIITIIIIIIISSRFYQFKNVFDTCPSGMTSFSWNPAPLRSCDLETEHRHRLGNAMDEGSSPRWGIMGNVVLPCR